MATNEIKKNKRITVEDLNSFRFLKIPKELIFNLEQYKNLSIQAILCYGLLYDRLELSAMNGWINKDGEVYLKFKKEVLMKLLRIGSKTTITKIFKELKKAELIEEKQIGCKQANEIYILKADFSPVQISDEELLDLDEKSNSSNKLIEKSQKKVELSCEASKINGRTENGRPKNVLLDVQKVYGNDTNYNNTCLEEEEVLKAYKEVKNRYLNVREKSILKELLKNYSSKLILKAIDIMVTDAEKVTLKYIQRLLEDWDSKGIKTVEEVDKMRQEWQEKSQIKKLNKGNNKKSTSENFKQRNYNFGDLEEMLLGHMNYDEDEFKE